MKTEMAQRMARKLWGRKGFARAKSGVWMGCRMKRFEVGLMDDAVSARVLGTGSDYREAFAVAGVRIDARDPLFAREAAEASAARYEPRAEQTSLF